MPNFDLPDYPKIDLYRIGKRLSDAGLLNKGASFSPPTDGASQPCSYFQRPEGCVRVDWKNTLTDQQIEQARQIVLSCGNLQDAIQDKINSLFSQVVSLVESQYPYSVLSAFCALYAIAIVEKRKDRQAYIEKLLSWGIATVAAYEAIKTQVGSLPTVQAVDDFIWDTSALKIANPKITLSGALGINT